MRVGDRVEFRVGEWWEDAVLIVSYPLEWFVMSSPLSSVLWFSVSLHFPRWPLGRELCCCALNVCGSP